MRVFGLLLGVYFILVGSSVSASAGFIDACDKSCYQQYPRHHWSSCFTLCTWLNRANEIAEELELPPVKVHCSILAEDAIKAAVADYKKKHQE